MWSFKKLNIRRYNKKMLNQMHIKIFEFVALDSQCQARLN